VQKTTVYEEDDITALHRSSWLQIKKERIRMPIIITILSAPSYKARRDLIRASWLKLAPETRNKYAPHFIAIFNRSRLVPIVT
jgi:hypothetical protein